MAKLKTMPAGEGWFTVVANDQAKPMEKKRRPTQWKGFNRANSYRWSFQRHTSNSQRPPWRRNTHRGAINAHRKAQSMHQLNHTRQPLMHNAINALIPYPVAYTGLPKPSSSPKNTISQHRITTTNINYTHIPSTTITELRQTVVMASEQSIPHHKPKYTQPPNPNNLTTTPLMTNHQRTPVPYIKYPKPPATLNLNINNPTTFAQALTSPSPTPPHNINHGPNQQNNTHSANRFPHTSHTQVGLTHTTLPLPLPRYQLPPWINYVDQNPWSTHLANEQTNKAKRNPLPLPPDPTHQAWRGRCFNCLGYGHDQGECRDTERVCAFCWGRGHEAKS